MAKQGEENSVPPLNKVDRPLELESLDKLSANIKAKLHSEVNLETVIEKSLDKFGNRIAPVIQGIAETYSYWSKHSLRATDDRKWAPQPGASPLRSVSKFLISISLTNPRNLGRPIAWWSRRVTFLVPPFKSIRVFPNVRNEGGKSRLERMPRELLIMEED